MWAVGRAAEAVAIDSAMGVVAFEVLVADGVDVVDGSLAEGDSELGGVVAKEDRHAKHTKKKRIPYHTHAQKQNKVKRFGKIVF